MTPLGKRKPEHDDLDTIPFLKKHSVEDKDTTNQANLISLKTVEEVDHTPHFVEEAAVRKKTLVINNLSRHTKVPDIIGFFKDVGQVVRVRLAVSKKYGGLMGYGYVEFASANEAQQPLQKQRGEYLHDQKISLYVVKMQATNFPPTFCIDHKVCLRRENLLLEHDETRGFFQEVLFVTNLSPQTKMEHIISFFMHVGRVVSVRLIVNDAGKHVGQGFVEFSSAYRAKKALENKNGEYLHDHKSFLQVAKTVPYPPRPKINLVEKLWYEDYLRRESLLIDEDEAVEGFDETSDSVEAVFIRKKTLFIASLSRQTEISHIISFFKDVGKVVHVRLFVNSKCKHIGYGFVEFASANEAKKALEKKDGEYLHDSEIHLRMASIAPYPPPRYCIDHKVWYDDYLRREGLVVEEAEAVEGLDDFIEEVAVRKKTLFITKLSHKIKISKIISFFSGVGEVSRVRLIVDHMGEFLDCGFVEFASAKEAKKALEEKNGGYLTHTIIFLDVAEIAPYPLRPKYNLAEKLWSEEYLRRFGEDYLETKPKEPKKPKMDEIRASGTHIIFSDDDDDQVREERLIDLVGPVDEVDKRSLFNV